MAAFCGSTGHGFEHICICGIPGLALASPMGQGCCSARGRILVTRRLPSCPSHKPPPAIWVSPQTRYGVRCYLVPVALGWPETLAQRRGRQVPRAPEPRATHRKVAELAIKSRLVFLAINVWGQ